MKFIRDMDKSRMAVLGGAAFFTLTSIGGLPLGLVLHSGDYLAIVCVTGGLATAMWIWVLMSQDTKIRQSLQGMSLLGLASIGGLAVYSNLAYIIWICGYPLSIGTVTAGKMADNYWLPPITLLYAVLMYFWLKWVTKDS